MTALGASPSCTRSTAIRRISSSVLWSSVRPLPQHRLPCNSLKRNRRRRRQARRERFDLLAASAEWVVVSRSAPAVTVFASATAREVLIVIVNIYLASEFGFSPLIANATSISRRIASDRDGLSFCCLAQRSMSDLNAGGSRSASTGLSPVRGRPRFFRNTGIDFLMFLYYVKGEPVESWNFPPALTQATEVSHGSG
jgi:hypothetical protein